MLPHDAPPDLDVLIAEDDALTRSSLRLLLEHQGYTCAEAQNGREAVDLARRRPPRCVFLDVAMPVLDGLAVARSLRADPRTRGAHIHCLTGHTDPDLRARADQAGCDTFLTKPVDAERLLAVVREQMQKPPVEEVVHLPKAQAEDLLDWLQNNGGRVLAFHCDNAGVAVRYARPAL